MTSASDISSAFLAARRAAIALEAYPGDVPASLEEAYAVQALSAANWGEPIAGYKVGGIGPQWREQYPSSWLAGPVFSSLVFNAKTGDRVDIPVFEGGFAAYEPELLMKLKNVSSITSEIKTIEEAKTYVSNLHIGAEIASSPLATLNELGPGSIISDFGNQAGVVIGPEIDVSWLGRFDDIHVTTTIDGEIIGKKSPGKGENGPLGALRFLLNHLMTHAPEGGIPETIWLSSGAITGVHKSRNGTLGHIDYGDLGGFEIAMTTRKPQRPDSQV